MAGFAYSTEVTDTRGLDPNVYRCVVGIVRRDGKPLTPAEVEAIKKALASEALPAEETPKATGTGGE
jgi:hypothetical protein